MIDKCGFIRQAELDLRNTRRIAEATCAAWVHLPAEARSALARAMAFLGCQLNCKAKSYSSTTLEAYRVAAARLMLLKLGLDADDPKWSSAVLERLVQAVIDVPDGSVKDLFLALSGVLGDYQTKLSQPIADLLKELVIVCFTRYNSSYDSVDWEPFIASISGNATQAQLYLALHAIPPGVMPSDLASAIADGLKPTCFRYEAADVVIA